MEQFGEYQQPNSGIYKITPEMYKQLRRTFQKKRECTQIAVKIFELNALETRINGIKTARLYKGEPVELPTDNFNNLLQQVQSELTVLTIAQSKCQ